MDHSHNNHFKPPTLKDKVYEYTGEAVENCYQCGKCSAGCPLINEMDIAPNQVLRMLQLEFPALDDRTLNSYSIWLCLACETCAARCPKEVDIPAIMDYLRNEAARRDTINPRAKDIVAFHRTFLESVRSNGRLHEVGLIAGYKMKTMHLMQDVVLAPTMMSKGLLNIIPHSIQNREAIKNMFAKTIEGKEG